MFSGGFQKVMCFVIFLFSIIADTQIITGMKRTVALAHQVFITLDSGRIILIQTICQCILTVDSDVGGVNLPIFLRGFNCFVEIRTGYVQCGELGGGKIVVGLFLLYIIVAPRGGEKLSHTFETLGLQMQGDGGTVFLCHQTTFS